MPVAGAERCWVKNRGIKTLVVDGVDFVNDLTLNVRVEDLYVDAEFRGIATDALVVFRQGHRTEYLELDLAPHIHPGAVDDQDFWHELSPHG